MVYLPLSSRTNGSPLTRHRMQHVSIREDDDTTNYFGEILVWIGVYVFTLQALSGLYIFIGVISPIYIAVLIIFVSGIPKLEKSADERWGNNPHYVEYKKKTSILIPFPTRS